MRLEMAWGTRRFLSCYFALAPCFVLWPVSCSRMLACRLCSCSGARLRALILVVRRSGFGWSKRPAPRLSIMPLCTPNRLH
jgi:hypothetical protein